MKIMATVGGIKYRSVKIKEGEENTSHEKIISFCYSLRIHAYLSITLGSVFWGSLICTCTCPAGLIFSFCLQPIGRLSFVGKSEYLLSVSNGLTPQLSVWSMSKLAASWSYGLQIEGLKIYFPYDFFILSMSCQLYPSNLQCYIFR